MARVVDLRSDTLTKPTKAMKHAMVNSALGDDVLGEDPTVNTLEAKVAAILGKQAALFVPSCTMANLIAIMVHCNKRGSELLVGDKSHIFKYEQGGAAQIAGVQMTTLHNNPDGTFDLDELERHVRGSDIHEPVTALVAVENTHNYCGGKVLPLPWLESLAAICKKHSLPLHMDGARLFNAAEYLQETPERIVRDCNTVSIAFSKGLSAPVGSALSGPYHFIAAARRMRKALGGGWRQAGVLAAAALEGLNNGRPQLALDHTRAQRLATAISSLQLASFRIESPPQSNIVLVRATRGADSALQRLAQVCQSELQGDCKTEDDEGIIVKAIQFDEHTLRFTLHRDVDDEDLWLAIMKIMLVFRELDAAGKVEKNGKD